MRILLITPDYFPNSYGGIGVYTYHLAQQLGTFRGTSVAVLLLSDTSYRRRTGHDKK